MRLFCCELKKLFCNGYRLYIGMLSFLLLSSGIYAARQLKGRADVGQQEALQQLITQYEGREDEAIDLFSDVLEQMRAWDTETMGTFPYSAAQIRAMQDYIRLANRQAEYESALQGAMQKARYYYDSLIANGASQNSFAAQYQIGLVRHYTEQLEKNISFPIQIEEGWSQLLSYNGDAVFLLLSWLLTCVVLLLYDRNSLYPILRSTKRGRRDTALAKLGAGMVVTLLLTLVFSVLPLLICYGRYGLQGGNLPLQAVYPYSPLHITAWQGFLVKILLRCLAGMVFVFSMMVLFHRVKSYVGAISIGLAWIALSYGAQTGTVLHAYHPLRLTGLFCLLSGENYISRYHAIDWFGAWGGDYQHTLPLILAGCCIALAVLFVLLYSRRANAVAVHRRGVNPIKWLKQLWTRLSETQRAKQKKRQTTYSNSLFLWEVRKRLCQRFGFVLLCLLVASQVLTLQTYYAPNETYEDAVYRECMEKYAGPWTEEKGASIQKEYRSIARLQSQLNDMEKAYEAGDISAEELDAFYLEYRNAEILKDIYDRRILPKVEYLSQCAAEGISVNVVYDTGWRLYVEEPLNAALAAVLILLLAGIFADEHTTGMDSLLKGTPKGRKNTVFAKIGAAMALSGGCAFLCEGLRLFVLQSRYSLPQGQAPVASIEVIGTDPRGSIVATIVTALLLRVLGAMLLAFLVGGCSAVSRSAVPTSLIVSTLVFFNAIQTVLSRDAAVLPLLDRVLEGTPLLMEKSTVVVAMVLFVISLAFYCSAIYHPERRKGK